MKLFLNNKIFFEWQDKKQLFDLKLISMNYLCRSWRSESGFLWFWQYFLILSFLRPWILSCSSNQDLSKKWKKLNTVSAVFSTTSIKRRTIFWNKITIGSYKFVSISIPRAFFHLFANECRIPAFESTNNPSIKEMNAKNNYGTNYGEIYPLPGSSRNDCTRQCDNQWTHIS